MSDLICQYCGERGDKNHFLEVSRPPRITGEWIGRCPSCRAGTEAIVVWEEWQDEDRETEGGRNVT